jgi:hypothetical protein
VSLKGPIIEQTSGGAMKRVLKHLLWIIPSIIVVVIVLAAAYSGYARSEDAQYHSTLHKSFQVTSTKFTPDQEMPVEYSCKGVGVSPQIQWTGAPGGTKSYALLTTDWDAPSPSLRLLAVSHWVLYNIPAGVNEVPEKASNDDLKKQGITVGLNIGGTEGYTPPCPPLGRHQYIFRVYALDVDQIHPESNTRNAVMDAMHGHVLGYGELIGIKSAG